MGNPAFEGVWFCGWGHCLVMVVAPCRCAEVGVLLCCWGMELSNWEIFGRFLGCRIIELEIEGYEVEWFKVNSQNKLGI